LKTMRRVEPKRLKVFLFIVSCCAMVAWITWSILPERMCVQAPVVAIFISCFSGIYLGGVTAWGFCELYEWLFPPIITLKDDTK